MGLFKCSRVSLNVQSRNSGGKSENTIFSFLNPQKDVKQIHDGDAWTTFFKKVISHGRIS
jgi:hypothetical protein